MNPSSTENNFKKKLDTWVPPFARGPLVLALALHFATYYGAKLLAQNRTHYDWTLPVDGAIPLVPWTIVIYVSSFAFWAVCYMLSARFDRKRMERFLSADLLMKLIGFLFFVAVPTTCARPAAETGGLWNWMLGIVYAADTPTNLFPSMHCYVSWLCYLGVKEEKRLPRGFRIFCLCFAAAISVSTVTTKQHVAADVLGGTALAFLSWWIAGATGLSRWYGRWWKQKEQVWVPSYYPAFHCIAGACRHSCCRGWEVDLDPESVNRYRQMADVKEHISTEGTPHFVLKGDRCPFLREDRLCQLILDHGEEALCQICADHPRFRNYWTGRVEMGLGLACEEAARIILTDEEPLHLVQWDEQTKSVIDDTAAESVIEALPEDERWLMNLREELLQRGPEEGIAPLPKGCSREQAQVLERAEKRLWEYLVYRQLADALYRDDLETRVAFTEWCYRTLTDRWRKTGLTEEALIEEARAFSVRYEYNTDVTLCPVCGRHVFEEPYEICPVCKWEHDRIQEEDPTWAGGANKMSLEEAKEAYRS